jgi:hypothetical protein
MNDDPLLAVYEYVERAYVRLQAGEVLNHCLDNGNPVPMQNLVEGLVLVGPQSLSVIREIIAEVGTRKAQLSDDRNQIYHRLTRNLKLHGACLPLQSTTVFFERITPAVFLAFLNQQGVQDDQAQIQCLRLFQDTKELISSLNENFMLLDDIERYLEDWLWGLIYQSSRQERLDCPPSGADARWLM